MSQFPIWVLNRFGISSRRWTGYPRPSFRERNKLLIRTLFDGCLRVSEAIQIKPGDLFQADGYWRVKVRGKGDKYSTVAISPSLATQLLAYAYNKGIERDARIFPVNPSRVFQIVQGAMEEAGVAKPGKVGSVHILRHSGALERLRETGNPQGSSGSTKGTRVSL